MGYDYGKIWVTGAAGRLGVTIHDMLDMRDVELLETDREELDITSMEEVALFGSRNRPNTIINCAGLTDVKECEENMEKAYKVNALGARNLSAAARKIDARIIQISTDDIFSYSENKSFHEFDTPRPWTVYGKSKLAGENFVKELAPKHLIIRSSWLYGRSGMNFVNSVMDKARKGEQIEAAVDEYACPTSARELCRLILRLVQGEQEGIFHAVCKGYCSRYELAQEIVRLMDQKEADLIPRKVEELWPDIKGPRYTILDNMMLRMCGIEEPVSWQAALKEYVENNKEK